jgi:hypothetical protein
VAVTQGRADEERATAFAWWCAAISSAQEFSMPSVFKVFQGSVKALCAGPQGPHAVAKQATTNLSFVFNTVHRKNAGNTLIKTAMQFSRRLGGAGKEKSSGAKSAMRSFVDRFSRDTTYSASGTKRTYKFNDTPIGDLIAAPAKAAGRAAKRSLLESKRALTATKPMIRRRGAVEPKVSMSVPQAQVTANPVSLAAEQLTKSTPIPADPISDEKSRTVKLTGEQFWIDSSGVLSPALLEALNSRGWPKMP